MYIFAFAHTYKDKNYAASSGELSPKEIRKIYALCIIYKHKNQIMAIRKILMKDLIYLILNKTIYLLEEVLCSNENAYTFRHISLKCTIQAEGYTKLYKINHILR